MAKKKRAAPEEELPFEAALEQLEQVVHDLEEGELGLSDALHRYEEGIRYMKHCHEVLRRAERKIELLTGLDADGQPVVEPLDEDDGATEGETRQAGERRTPRKRRQKPANEDPDVDTQQGLF